MADYSHFENKNNFTVYDSIESLLIKHSKYVDAMKYSIVIPTFGRADLLKEALESCLNQTYEGDYEILVVDNDPMRNNDTEILIDSIASNRITYYKNARNIGCLPNFNRCIELARSKYLFMLHTDDLLYDIYLETLIPIIENNPNIDMIIPGKKIIRNGIESHQKGYAFLARILKADRKVIRLNEKDFCYYNITGGPLGIAMKKDACINIGGFDENLFPVSDYAFWVRFAKKYNAYYLPLELGLYRFLDNISSQPGIQRSYIENEYVLINELSSNKKSRFFMKGYLYEYINYRIRVAGLDKDDVYTGITGKPYAFSLMKKIGFIFVLVFASLSFLKRSVLSRIKAI